MKKYICNRCKREFSDKNLNKLEKLTGNINEKVYCYRCREIKTTHAILKSEKETKLRTKKNLKEIS